MCWHYDSGKGRAIKGINVLNALYHNGEVSVPVAFEVIHKPIRLCDVTTSRAKLFIKANQIAYAELQKMKIA